MLLMLDVRPERKPDLETHGKLQVTPPVPYRTYLDDFGNRCTRLVAPAGILQLSNRFIIRDSGVQESLPWGAGRAEVDDLPDGVLLYLLGSLYCYTDRLATEAWKLFGQIPPGWPRAQAILNYVHDRISFGY